MHRDWGRIVKACQPLLLNSANERDYVRSYFSHADHESSSYDRAKSEHIVLLMELDFLARRLSDPKQESVYQGYLDNHDVPAVDSRSKPIRNRLKELKKVSKYSDRIQAALDAVEAELFQVTWMGPAPSKP